MLKRPARVLKKNLTKVIPFLAIVVSIYLIFLAGFYVGKQSPIITPKSERVINTTAGRPSDIDFSLYWEAWNKLMEKSTLTPEPKKMIQGSIAGMMASLGDPYTTYFEPSANKQFKEDLSGQFDGIGVEIIQKNSMPTVVAPLSDSPAEKAGLKPNDTILTVDDQKTVDLGFNETINKIRGKRGTTVKLTIARENINSPIDINLTRDTIVVKSVEWSYQDAEGKKIEYIKIRQFGDDTSRLFAAAADEALKTKPQGIIIDLRNNPGGYLESAVDLASYFIKDGVIVSEKGKHDNHDYKTVHNATLDGFNLAVLVNNGSASASEIFSGAIQDRSAGKIIGVTTFGKGCVQELIDLSDGSAAKITIANWLTPLGRQISDKGITPDITVQNNDNSKDDAQLNRAIDYIKNGK